MGISYLVTTASDLPWRSISKAATLLPKNVSVIDAGTSVRGILFDLIVDEQRPRRIIVIDAIDANRRPGEIFRIDIEEIPKNKVDDFRPSWNAHFKPAQRAERLLSMLK